MNNDQEQIYVPVDLVPKINTELLRESLRIMHWDQAKIDFIIAAVEGKNVRG